MTDTPENPGPQDEPTRQFETPPGSPPPAAPYTAGGDGQVVAGPPPRRRLTGATRVGVLAAAGGLVIGAVLGGLIGWGVTGDSGGSSRAAVAQASHSHRFGDGTGGTQNGGGQKRAHRARGVVGTIDAINGDSWTLTTAKGQNVTVTITASTAFGTTRTPQQRTDFAVGDRVAATGTRTDGALTATHVVKRTAPTTAPSSSAPVQPS
ncbi:DUF5666 domain-containing protein [Williamsia deligens]|uniref:DUF5666 domain-containing protein n=1 Tax=Williamsia deligens TaxID=321325 RepID=A0ABW3GAK0_9NOCA|nr:DUF5666 domain-containing protein [Williamsia deligens]MCP2193216.1 hypothetical protein [Williamsia deligens]